MKLMERIAAALERLAAAQERIAAAAEKRVAAPAAGGISDAELDTYGDEKIRMNPRDWKGEPYKGRKFSESEAGFLDLYAETMDYFASKQDDKRKASYDTKSGLRARGWAARLRSGWKKPAASPSTNGTAPPDFGPPPQFGPPTFTPPTSTPTTAPASDDRGYPPSWDEDEDEEEPEWAQEPGR